MDFEFDDAQRLLKDSITRLMAERYGFADRRRYGASAAGFSPEMWTAYAELGLLGLPFAEEDGGSGLGPVETMIVMEAFGQALALEPYLSCVCLCGALLRHGATPLLRQEWATAIGTGQRRVALAHHERPARYDLNHVQTTACAADDGFLLDGAKSLVLHGDSADSLIVSARSCGDPAEPEGVSLFLVDKHLPGLSLRTYPTQDGGRAADISLSGVRVSRAALIGAERQGLPLLHRAVDEAIAALCAEAVGAMEAMLALTIDHLKTRRQFGVAIGSFQSLQHRAADMALMVEQARSAAMYAAMMAGSDNAPARARAMSAAKIQIGLSARHVGRAAIQMFGGVGVTDEYKVAHLFKRLTMIDIQFGDVDEHLERLGRSGSLF